MRRFMVIVLVSLATAAGAQSPSASGSRMMLTGQILRSANGDYLTNNGFVLIMQADGNLCEYFGTSAANHQPAAIWCSNTSGAGGRFSVQMHSTNNFCVTTGDEWGQGPALWCTNLVGPGTGPAFAILNGDGNFFIQTGTPATSGALLWQTGNVFSQVVAVSPGSAGSIQWSDGAVCPPACAEVLRVGANVSLAATPAPGYTFNGWSGSCAGMPNPCTRPVVAGGMQNSAAIFNVTLSATAPTGGVIRWSNGATCGGSCTFTAQSGAVVAMTAEPTPPYQFVSWAGPCASATTPTCTLTAAANMPPVSANMQVLSQVAVAPPNGVGAIQWGDGAMCPAMCAETLVVGTNVSLMANPAPGYSFGGWTGSCAGKLNPCVLAVAAGGAQTSAAIFNVTLSAMPPTGGAIRWADGSTCPSSCNFTAQPGIPVTITAVATSPYQFASWTGPCASQSSPTCTLTAGPNMPPVSANMQQPMGSTIPSGAIVVFHGASGRNLSAAAPETLTLAASSGLNEQFEYRIDNMGMRLRSFNGGTAKLDPNFYPIHVAEMANEPRILRPIALNASFTTRGGSDLHAGDTVAMCAWNGPNSEYCLSDGGGALGVSAWSDDPAAAYAIGANARWVIDFVAQPQPGRGPYKAASWNRQAIYFQNELDGSLCLNCTTQSSNTIAMSPGAAYGYTLDSKRCCDAFALVFKEPLSLYQMQNVMGNYSLIGVMPSGAQGSRGYEIMRVIGAAENYDWSLEDPAGVYSDGNRLFVGAPTLLRSISRNLYLTAFPGDSQVYLAPKGVGSQKWTLTASH
jgi:hypothetical protein